MAGYGKIRTHHCDYAKIIVGAVPADGDGPASNPSRDKKDAQPRGQRRDDQEDAGFAPDITFHGV